VASRLNNFKTPNKLKVFPLDKQKHLFMSNFEARKTY
jgi:hypothetical protein